MVQEIFLNIGQHYNLDRLIEYGTESIPDTIRVINPAWRELDSQIRRQNALLNVKLNRGDQVKKWSKSEAIRKKGQ